MPTRHCFSILASAVGALSISASTSCTNTITGFPDEGNGVPPVPGGTGGSAGTSSTTTGGSAAGGAAGTGGMTPSTSDLPCDIQNLLNVRCVVCHTEEPPSLLGTRADLLAPSVTDASRTVAEEALLRMRSSGTDLMPPLPMDPANAAEIAGFESWLAGGAAPATCGSSTPVGPDPYDTPVVCTSGRHWTGGDEESPLMHPGGACIDCHTREDEGPRLVVAGTLYPTPHEPTDCNGVGSASGATIVVTDANGMEHRMTPNAAGNFFYEGAAFPFPYTAKVSYGGRERVMVEKQDNGDCNECHSEAGASRAPGRIFLP